MPRRRRGSIGIAAAATVLAAARLASAQTGVWTTNGPNGGSFFCIVPDPFQPSILFAGTVDGVFRSDRGDTIWRAANTGLNAVRVRTIAVDPTHPSTLYAGTLTPDGVPSLGIFKSVDGGASWTPINEGLTDPLTGISPLDVEALAVDPSNPSTLLAGTRFSEIFKSTDGGLTWDFKTFGGFALALEVSDFRFVPSDPARIYAASTQGLILSTDGGESWSFFGDAGVSFFVLAIDPTSPTTIYGGTVSGFGVFKSTNGGAHWIAANTNLPVHQSSGASLLAPVLSLVLDPSQPSSILVGTNGDGLFHSADGAATWSPANSGMRDSVVISLAFPAGQTTIYAGTLAGGVYRSLDGAATWAPSSVGLNLALVPAVVADPGAPGRVFAATLDGVATSSDGGGHWHAANAGLPIDPVDALALVAGPNERLLAGTLGGGLLASTDGGASWSASAQGLTDSFVASIAVDPSSPRTVYAGTAHPYDGSNSERVFKSADGGISWTQTGLDAHGSTIDALAVNPADSSQIAAITRGAATYFQSLDAGATWSTVTPDASCGAVNTILFDAAHSTIDLGDTSGVCRSADGGTTWSVTAVGSSTSILSLLIDPADPNALYAGAGPAVAGGTGGVFRSTDGGQTWEPLGAGLSAASVRSLAKDASGDALYAGIYGGGVASLALVPPTRLPVQPAAQNRQTRLVDTR